MNKKNIKIFIAIFFLSVFVFLPSAFALAQGVNLDKPAFDGIVPCGNGENDPCTLCHLIVGIQRLVQYGLYLVTTAAFVGIFIAGAMYMVSAGDTGMIESAKKFLAASLISFGLVLGAWLIINVILTVMPVAKNLGIGKANWYTFVCSTKSTAGSGGKFQAKTQASLAEGDSCIAGKAPYCKDGLSCISSKCVPDTTAKETCAKETTKWAKTNDCSSLGGYNYADWNCTACKGAKPGDGYKCCGGVTDVIPAPMIPAAGGGCCQAKRPSGQYNCFNSINLAKIDCMNGITFASSTERQFFEGAANFQCVTSGADSMCKPK